MTEPADETRVERRADLLPEERAAGSDDPEAQARAILEESDERTEHPDETWHASTQTPDLTDPPEHVPPPEQSTDPSGASPE